MAIIFLIMIHGQFMLLDYPPFPKYACKAVIEEIRKTLKKELFKAAICVPIEAMSTDLLGK